MRGGVTDGCLVTGSVWACVADLSQDVGVVVRDGGDVLCLCGHHLPLPRPHDALQQGLEVVQLRLHNIHTRTSAAEPG